jgi:type IV secretion system protein VirB6
MFAPIGTFLTYMDNTLSGSMDGLIAAMTSAMAVPVALAAVVYYGVQGLKLANGDSSPLQNFVPQLIRVGMVVYLSSNLDGFNQWVRGIFFTGLPNALATAIASATGSIGASNAPSSVVGAAAAFDALWAQTWVIVGTVFMQVGWSVMGAVAALAGILTALFGGLGLLAMALVYIGARMVLGVVVCLAPVIIGCAMFDATRPIFERAVGKVIALVLLQTAGLVVLQIVLTGNQIMMAQASTASLASLTNAASLPGTIQMLVSLIVWFAAGAVAMYSLPAIAYSIGSGVAMSGPSLFSMAMLARGLGGGGGGGAAAAAPSSSPPMSLSLAYPNVSGGSGGGGALPPPPPPAISQSTRR